MSYCQDILHTAKGLGISEAEAVYSKKKITTIRITDSEIAEIKEIFDQGISARLVQDKKIFSVKTQPDKISKCLQDSTSITKYLKPKEFWKQFPHQASRAKVESTFDVKLRNISGRCAADIAQSMINESLDAKISTVTGSLNIVSETFEIANSSGLEFRDENSYISGIINADSGTVSGMGHSCCRTLDSFDAQKIGQDAKNMCLESQNPIKTESGRYSIIFEPYSVGEILAFVFAANFNLQTCEERKSCFSEKQNKKIASDILTITDDPFVAEGIGSKSIDDEGVPTKKLALIENGIFRDMYTNLHDAYRFDSTPTGNASRLGSPMGTSADPNPICAPHNIRIEKSTCKKEDILKDVKKGIRIGRLWYTYALNPICGDFSCTARSGIQIIENGKIKAAGRPIRIIHNLKKLLQDTVDIADDVKNVQQWDSLPSIVPTVRFDDIMVNSI